MIKSNRLLRQGRQAYCTHVVDTEKQTSKLEEIPVMNELEDVSPEDLLGLPPEMEIKFTIDLVPGTEPISKARNRMAPVEMKELAIQRSYKALCILIWSPCVIREKERWDDALDYRELNKMTIKNSYPLPRIDGLWSGLFFED